MSKYKLRPPAQKEKSTKRWRTSRTKKLSIFKMKIKHATFTFAFKMSTQKIDNILPLFVLDTDSSDDDGSDEENTELLLLL